MPELADPREVAAIVFSWLDADRHTDAAAHRQAIAGWQAAELDAAVWTMQVHGIAPLIYMRLKGSLLWPSLPAPLQSRLAENYRLNRERVHALMGELCTLLRAAAEEGIRVIPLKGSPLVFEYYEDPGLRPMADLDILAHANDLPLLDEVLRRVGYEIDEEHITPRHWNYALTRFGRVAVHVDGEHPDNPHLLDVHAMVGEHSWGIHYDITEDLWQDTRTALFGDVPALSPQPVALLQHLLIHTSRVMFNGYLRLIALYDISLVAERLRAGDWQQLLRAGQKRREERMLYAPLALAVRYFDCRVPHDIMEQLKRGSPPGLVAFLNRADAYQLSFCNPVGPSLKDRSRWYRSAGESLMIFLSVLFPSPRVLAVWRPQLKEKYPLSVVYAIHLLRVITGQIQSMLRQPSRTWRRAQRVRQAVPPRDRSSGSDV